MCEVRPLNSNFKGNLQVDRSNFKEMLVSISKTDGQEEVRPQPLSKL